EAELRAAGATVTGAAVVPITAVLALAAAVRAHVLGLVLRLAGVGVVRCLRIGRGVGVLRREAGTAADMAGGDRYGRVRVDGILVALRQSAGALLGVGDLRRALEATRAAAAGAAIMAVLALAAAVRAHVLGLVLRLAGVGVVRCLRIGRGVGVLRRVARAGRDVAAHVGDAHVCIAGAVDTLIQSAAPLL